jgi:predicted ATPase
MKVQSVQLKNFKKFQSSPEFDFTDPETGLARDIIILVGMNGAGKTSLLQAIPSVSFANAATLGTATGRLQKLSDLEWKGFNYELLSNNWGDSAPDVNIKVQFSSPELEAIQNLQQKLLEMGRNVASPAQNHLVTLKWVQGLVQAESTGELLQFRGREYAKQLRRTEGFEVFEQVGTVLWYTEQRTSTSLTTEDPERKLEITEDLLRDSEALPPTADRLSKWRLFHQDVESAKIHSYRQGQKDLYAEIERAYKIVFPERSFVGPVLRENIDDILSEPWFYLNDSSNQYEISEMSGGERAIFPMLMDFASWNIHNSVILIDEIELHLHPPMQQAILRALPKLGKNNQFIITTHSDYIEQLVPSAYIIRFEV